MNYGHDTDFSKLLNLCSVKDFSRISTPVNGTNDSLKQTISLQIFKKLSSANFTWSILKYFITNILESGTRQIL